MSIKELVKQVGDVEYKVTIDYDYFAESPREYKDGTFLCIREYNRYDFPNELDFDWVDWDDEDHSLPHPEDLAEEKKLKLFWLDCYEHGSIHFPLANENINGFDTSSNCGFIMARDEEQAKAEIEEYNQYINGECYILEVSERSILEKDGKTFYSDWEELDMMSCIGWENLRAPSQFPFEEGEWELHMIDLYGVLKKTIIF